MVFAVVAGVASVALAAMAVWWAADRLWHVPVILLLAVLLFPLAAMTRLTGDVSRYLPADTFAPGLDGKDQIIVASAVASFLLAIVLASCLWGIGKFARRSLRRQSP